MDTNWIYYGIFFNDKTKALLFEKAKPYIPEGWKTYCHHMTIIFNDKSEEKNREAEALEICVGNHESLMVTGVGISDRAVAFSVDYETQNSVSHITIATAPGAKPVESNNITDWKPIEPFYVTGIVDKFTKNGNSMKITENELKGIVSESVKRILKEGLIHPTEYGNDIVFKAQSPSQIFKLNNWTYTTESKDNGVLMLRCYTDNNNSFEMGNFPEFEKVVDDLNKFYKYHGSKTVAEAIPDDGVSRGRLLKVYKRA